jgi:hypothetical protein
MKKLTLNAEPEVIEEAKRLADASGTSVSALFERFIRLLSRRQKSKPRLGPIARELTGVINLPRGKSERDVLAEALMEKYGIKK